MRPPEFVKGGQFLRCAPFQQSQAQTKTARTQIGPTYPPQYTESGSHIARARWARSRSEMRIEMSCNAKLTCPADRGLSYCQASQDAQRPAAMRLVRAR